MADAPRSLRPYQTDLIGKVEFARAVEGKRRLLLVQPTGAGKTVVAAAIIADAVANGQRVLFIAHRRELITQARDRLGDFGIDAGIILAGCKPQPDIGVQIASIQTLWARAVRTSAIGLPAGDLIFIDEAHRARAMTYEEILARYPDATVIGLTATPLRADGRGLGNLFDCMIEGPQVQTLIDGKFLVATTTYAPVKPDLKGVSIARGDFAIGELGERMDRAPLIGDIVSHWCRHAHQRKTVCFATTVPHARHLCEEFQKAGVRAAYLHSSTPKDERDDMLGQLASGEMRIVVNCMVLVEGWDQPGVSCVILARPTRSLGLYRQMVGRGLRPAPGKADLLVLDHAGGVFAHGFVEDEIAWSLATDSRTVNERHTARQADHRTRLTDCPQCGALRTAGEPCQCCGWKPQPKAEHFDVIDEDLGRIDRNGAHQHVYTQADKDRWLRELTFIGEKRGYKRSWASVNFKQKFGYFPRRGIRPLPQPPSPEVLSWVRSRMIAYAKARSAA